MLHIGICDDEPILAEMLLSDLKDIFAESSTESEISIYKSGKELLEMASGFDLVFLDLTMPEMDGREVGLSLCRRNPDCKIIIVSGMEHRIRDGFEIRARWFLSKPVQKEDLRYALSLALLDGPGQKTIGLYRENRTHTVRQHKISYLEAYDSYTRFYVSDTLFRRNESLKYFLDELDPQLFVQISRSHIINLQMAFPSSDFSMVTLNQQNLKVSRRYRNSFQKSYLDYTMTYGGL